MFYISHNFLKNNSWKKPFSAITFLGKGEDIQGNQVNNGIARNQCKCWKLCSKGTNKYLVKILTTFVLKCFRIPSVFRDRPGYCLQLARSRANFGVESPWPLDPEDATENSLVRLLGENLSPRGWGNALRRQVSQAEPDPHPPQQPGELFSQSEDSVAKKQSLSPAH